MSERQHKIMVCEHGIDFRDHCGVCDVNANGGTAMGPTIDEVNDDLGGGRSGVAALAVDVVRGKEPIPQGRLPSGSQERKDIPIATGCLDYFPLALAEIAKLSRIGNDKHNPGQPLHWSRGKSNDHPDCLMRHFMERGTVDRSGAEPVRHSTQMAWRALAILQLELEGLREAQRVKDHPASSR